MKKFIKYFSFLIIIFVVMTGCSANKIDKKLINKLIDNAESIKSASYFVEIYMLMEMGDYSLEMTVETNAKYDELENAYATMTQYSNMFEPTTLEMYAINEEDGRKTYGYEPEFGWYYYFESKDEVEKYLMPHEQIIKLLKCATSSKEVKSDKDGYTKVLLTANLIEVIDIFSINLTIGNNSVEYPKERNIEVAIYIKDDFVTSVEIDMSEIAEENAVSLYGDEINVEAKFSFELSEINQVQLIELSEEAKNAKSVEEIEKNIISNE